MAAKALPGQVQISAPSPSILHKQDLLLQGLAAEAHRSQCVSPGTLRTHRAAPVLAQIFLQEALPLGDPRASTPSIQAVQPLA